jgi:hypothetical protein
VGKVVQPLQSVNYHDSRAHGHEQHGPFTRLVGILVGMVWVGSSRSVLCYAVGVTPVSLRPLITVGNLGAWSCLDIV